MSENIAFIEHRSIPDQDALLGALETVVERVIWGDALPVLLTVGPGHVGVWTPSKNVEHIKTVGEKLRQIGQALVEQADTAPSFEEPRA